MRIPFLPQDPFAEDHDVILDLVHEVGHGERFILGERVASFERKMERLLDASIAVACDSHEGALSLAMRAVGVGRGDEVLVPAFGGEVAASAALDLGATPVFVDVSDRNLGIDADLLRDVVTRATRAVVAVHVLSEMADMAAVRAASDHHGLAVIEDASGAQGAVLAGIPAGRWGDIGVLSFSPANPLGSCGEGGMVVTGSVDLGTRCRMLRNHGQDGVHRFLHHVVGSNNRMDEIIAGLLLHRFGQYRSRLERFATIATRYTERLVTLADEHVRTPPSTSDGRSPAVYAIRTNHRDELQADLCRHGIGTQVHRVKGRDLPNADAARWQHLALPIHTEMTDSQVEFVADSIVAFFRQPSRRKMR